MKKVVILGDSGHSKVVADLIHSNEGMSLTAKLDDRYDEVFVGEGVTKGPISHLRQLLQEESNIYVVLGIGSNVVRKKLVKELGVPRSSFISLIHPTAVISPSAVIGLGTVIMPRVVVNADTIIGDHAILNTGSIIEHDCKVADYTHISPQAILAGGVAVGEGAHIGAGASVIPLKTVGEWSTIGAGAAVVSNINRKVTAVGVPAKEIRKEGI
ncbi:sugar O-acyltransferase, sialic acid O-acetyltransferase NeuD family [Bhargavaea ginsengi]|uniref:Sugar O-acyltransferase, sialic acid O-acetyltransferase NeuD family n=1 Tax=Bhargavaea ginsengi TaxID=426757 RepID=A0A1H6UIU2_9BACL|nr:acetyltransferase [Bhargavaea ginsengi]SEI92199.1 sugar O-acyltransferase, sialic acid O-acetyltransferase NeuD family [Bhargavaea ginsengi]